MQSEIENQSDNYLLNVNETEFTKYIVSKYTVEPLEIYFDRKSASTHEVDVRAENFPSGFHVYEGKRYKKDVIRYHIPYAGNAELLRRKPSTFVMWTTDIIVERDEICFDIIDFYNDAKKIKEEADLTLNRLATQLSHVREQVDAYNSSLEMQVKKTLQARKTHLLKKNDILSELGVPVRKRDDVPETFSVPSPQIAKKIVVKKPEVIETGYKPEPTLDESVYNDILRIIHDLGRQFERMPSTYKNKEEEDLRDQILLFLEPKFEGSATGETFNKSGKTDILLRYEGKNVFIAECKFWTGEKGFLKTISQLIKYLTWRDSKAAVILFVRNRDFSSVIDKVKDAAPEHENYLGFVDEQEDSWLNYRFHIEGDPNREVKLAVLLFHFPPTDS